MEITNSTKFGAGDQNISEQENEMEHNQLFEDNPLDNELILDVIMDHLNPEDWKPVRLVNKTFHFALQKEWRNAMTYRLGSDETKVITPKFLEQRHPSNDPNDSMLLERHPIRNVSSRQNWDNSFILFQPDQTRFWELFGHGLTFLDLHCIRIHQGQLLKRLLFELTPSLIDFTYFQCICDDMEQLSLNTITSYTPPAKLQVNLLYLNLDTTNLVEGDSELDGDYEYLPRFPISWIEFFSVFPNIQKLTLDIDPDGIERPSDLMKLFEAIEIIRKANNNTVLNIKDLYMGDVGFLYAVDMRNISSDFTSLPISTLNICLAFFPNEERIFLIQIFQSTLRDLSIMNNDDPEDEFLPINVLPKGLTRLSLIGPFFSSLEFLANTPNLETLHLTVKDIACMLQLLQPDVYDNMSAVSSLMNLKIKSIDSSNEVYPELSHVEVAILAKLMPNLKKYSCVFIVDAEGFQVLCQGCPNLEKLNIALNLENEDIFLVNLARLKCLKSLKMKCCNFKFTDKSVFEGFLKLLCLTTLRLESDLEVTEKGLSALKTKLGSGLIL